jgi:NADPH:quinone reductase-like Zn-dependent oxidoreductase
MNPSSVCRRHRESFGRMCYRCARNHHNNEDPMKAYALTAADRPAAFVDLPDPQAPDRGLLIRVRAASVNGIDVYQAKGFLIQTIPHEFPSIVGRDFAGIVEAVGDGRTDIVVGDEVLGFVLAWPIVQVGTYAELVAGGPELAFVRKPAGLSFETAAAIPLAGATALDAVDAVEVGAGVVLLVVGATGGVGSIAIQLAAQRGATVIATARAGDEAEFVRSLGASATIDYTAGDLAQAVRARYPGGIDALIDLVNRKDALAAVSPLVRDGGGIATTMSAADVDGLAARSIRATNVTGAPTPGKLADLVGRVAAGTLRIELQQTFPFEEVPAALAAFVGGTRGKVVLRVG